MLPFKKSIIVFVFSILFWGLNEIFAGSPFKVHSQNPRYFTDGRGRAILLTGSHVWDNRQDITKAGDNHRFNFTGYLNWMQEYNHNFIRLWVWEQAKWHPYMSSGFLFNPTIYMRTGPGTALDGGPKFDVTKFNQEFFDRLRSRVVEAGKRGFYVSLMLFEGWSVGSKKGNKENPWCSHPFNRENNINGIDGDINGDGEGNEINTMNDNLNARAVRELQELYIKKVIDTVNDLDNVLYEIGNEFDRDSEQWQYHIINFIKNYETQYKPKQHPVWMTVAWGSGNNDGLNAGLFKSPADVISPNPEGGYRDNPPVNDGKKIIIADTDHLWGIGGNQKWVWKSFLRGLHPVFMDPYDAYYAGAYNNTHKPFDARWDPIRRSMGYARSYAEKMNLAGMTPRKDLSSTGYCLANPGVEYLVYQPSPDTAFTINLKAGTYSYEWFNPSEGMVTGNGSLSVQDGVSSFIPPSSGDAVLYLRIVGTGNKESNRTREKFDFGWTFHKGDIPIQYSVKAGETGGLTDFKRSGKPDDESLKQNEWVEVNLPHDWCVEENFVHDDKLGSRPASHGYLPYGIGFYRKFFEIPANDKEKKILIEFDGIYRNSTVWVNGHLMGAHSSGYTSFYYDITDVVRYGDKEKNVIFVKVDARECEGWWYEGCGIYRHVWLTKTDRLHVDHWGTYVTTPKITDKSAKVTIRTIVSNEYKSEKQCELISTIVDADSKIISMVSATKIIPTHNELEFEQAVNVNLPKLWSPDSPYLYKVVIEVRDGGSIVDTYETPIGIRSIEFTADKGFFLNGKPLVIKGTCNHQDFAGVGVALPDRIIEYKIQLLKEMGSNAYRSSHHPPTPELLDVCDRLGIMVMDENRKLDSSPEGIANLKSMLYRDRNHPSIILWNMENEEYLEGTEMGAHILNSMVETAHQIDPTRPVLAAMNHGWNQGGYSDVLDIVGYNYGHRNSHDVNDHAKFPHRKMIGSETTSSTTTRGIYGRDDVKGYCPAYPIVTPPWACDPERPWRDLVDNPFLTGMFVWTGFDYRGEPTPFNWPCINSHFGIMDVCGFPKDSYYYYKSVWTDEPIVHLFPHWNWQGKEGKDIEVWAYSNCESVELFLNNQSFGEKKMIPNSHLAWNVKYIPGELTAKGRKDGQVVAATTISTTNSPSRILLTPDRNSIKADGCDVSIIRVSILDDKNRVVPIADNEVSFSVEGQGRIIGVGNGNPSSHEPDKSTIRRAFNGYCLAIVQAGNEPGNIILKGASPGLITDEVTISVR